MNTAPGLFAELLTRAKAQKSRDLGRPYTFPELEADSGISASHIWSILYMGSVPSKDTVRFLSRALSEYLPADEAMLAAGYSPDGMTPKSLQEFFLGKIIEGLEFRDADDFLGL